MNDTKGPRSYIRWVAVLSVNTVLGALFTMPMLYLWLFLQEYPLAALGLASREPTNNDGVLPWLLLIIPLLSLGLLLWLGINVLLRKWAKLPARQHWPACAAVVFGLSTVLAVFPWLWMPLFF